MAFDEVIAEATVKTAKESGKVGGDNHYSELNLMSGMMK